MRLRDLLLRSYEWKCSIELRGWYLFMRSFQTLSPSPAIDFLQYVPLSDPVIYSLAVKR